MLGCLKSKSAVWYCGFRHCPQRRGEACGGLMPKAEAQQFGFPQPNWPQGRAFPSGLAQCRVLRQARYFFPKHLDAPPRCESQLPVSASIPFQALRKQGFAICCIGRQVLCDLCGEACRNLIHFPTGRGQRTVMRVHIDGRSARPFQKKEQPCIFGGCKLRFYRV